MSYRDYAIRLLVQIAAGIRSGRIVGLGLEERKYLLEVCDLAESDHPDPLGFKRPKGRPYSSARHMAIAKEVARLHWDEGMALEEACAKAGEAFSVSGENNGTAEKAFRRHENDLKAARIVYRARKEFRSFTPEEKQEFKEALQKSLKPVRRPERKK